MSKTPTNAAANSKRKRPTLGARFFGFLPSPLLSLLIIMGAGLPAVLHAGVAAALQLTQDAQVDSRGVYLSELVKSDHPLPPVRLCDAPEFGKTNTLSRLEVNNLLVDAAPDLATTNWTGSDTVTISRRTHSLTQMDTLNLLTGTLQRDYIKDKGQLDLDFTQPWDAPQVPDEPLTVKVLELPISGVTPFFIIRFELCHQH